MANDITGINGSRPNNNADAKQVSNKGVGTNTSSKGGNAGTAAAPTDTLNLTSIGRQLQTLTDSIADLPIVDAGRVEAVKNSIEDGSFRIDPPQVALKFLSFEATVHG